MPRSAPSDVPDLLVDQLIRAIERRLLPHPPERVGVAVSGGSDSLALLCLMCDFAKSNGITVFAATVDHGLRAQSRAEAEQVAAICKDLGAEHEILSWQDRPTDGNLQNEARIARYRLLAEWARRNNLQTVALGHTQDDQAETVVMRLARGAGVDGLTAMTPHRLSNGITWIRPLLDQRRSELRLYLESVGMQWVDDPSNEDLQYDRVRVRQALELLSPLGVSVPQLAQVASNMSKARDALDWHTFLNAREIARVEAGAVALHWKRYRTLPEEIARRMIVRAISWISGSGYPPRRSAVQTVLSAIREGKGSTLDGCQIRKIGCDLWIFRELKPVADLQSDKDALWDGRWSLCGCDALSDLHIRALDKDGLTQCPEWRDAGLPYDVLLSTPSVWEGDTLVASPFAGFANGCRFDLKDGDEAFFAALLSH